MGNTPAQNLIQYNQPFYQRKYSNILSMSIQMMKINRTVMGNTPAHCLYSFSLIKLTEKKNGAKRDDLGRYLQIVCFIKSEKLIPHT